MRIFTNPYELQHALKAVNTSIGFVPTMGALHAGHKALIDRCVEENSVTVVSIFVNPTQFLEGEDLHNYPNRLEADKQICKRSHVDFLFLPTVKEVYVDKDECLIEPPAYLGYILEGATRKGHFSGVLQIVNKLFHIVQPTRAYFGQKDAQQLRLIQKMVQHFFMDIEIVAMPTVRDSDGLALSSRNHYLDKEQRKQALKLSRALKEASAQIQAGEMQISAIRSAMYATLSPLRVEYLAIVSYDFRALQQIELKNTLILLEVMVGETRLLDNMWI